jgi:hypothetical protein
MRSLRLIRASSTVNPIKGLGWQGYVPVLLEQIHILTVFEMGAVNLFLPGRGVRQGNQFDGLDTHG